MSGKFVRGLFALLAFVSVFARQNASAATQDGTASQPATKAARIAQGMKGRVDLIVKIEVPTQCEMGDVDIMRYDQYFDKNPVRRLILSLEAVSPEDADFKPIVLELPKLELLNGLKTTMNVPLGEKPRQLGLFVCKDSAREGKCLGKRSIPLAKMYKFYSKKVSTTDRDNFARNDKIFYFQYLLATNSKIEILGADPQGASQSAKDEHYANLSKLVLSTGQSEESLKKTIQSVRNMTERANSQPVEMDGNKVRVKLPIHDRRACK